MKLRPYVTLIVALLSAIAFSSHLCAESSALDPAAFPGEAPGEAVSNRTRDVFSLSNKVLQSEWELQNGHLLPRAFTNRLNGRSSQCDPRELFQIALTDGRVLRSSELKLSADPVLEKLAPAPTAPRFAERLGGAQLKAAFESPDGTLHVDWRAVLRDGSNYIRHELALNATADVKIKEIVLIQLSAPDAKVAGTVEGSPVATDGEFFGFEHPMSKNTVEQNSVRCALPRDALLAKGGIWNFSSVIGVAPAGQMRRAFLAYIERERAHPYRPFLHYNSWYDLGYFKQYNEKESVAVIETFARELAEKRGAVLSSFLFDDGWDDYNSLWSFHQGFPNGFIPLKDAAVKAHAGPGVWLSPFGGYGKPHEMRLAFGRSQGCETNSTGFSLAGPKYYARFRDICMQMIRKYGVNQFKFDGLGGNGGGAGNFVDDFNAAMHLIAELRAESPDLYINLTTGTWPSPFWLISADSIWRGAEDHDFAGVGTWRQKWMTYRDGTTYDLIVRRAPLYPLNSLMLHGIIYAKHAQHLADDPANDFDADVWSFFGSGTQLQELYCTPAHLSDKNWDSLAAAAKWARDHAMPLADSHWIGGDPLKLEVYGHAGWSGGKGYLVLRNPSDHPAEISLDMAAAFELAGAATSYRLHCRRGEFPEAVVKAGTLRRFQLKSFEVIVLDAEVE